MKLSPQLKSLSLVLAGKRLLLSEIPYQTTLIQEAVQKGYVQQMSGLQTSGSRYSCVRCGNKDKSLLGSHHCARCQTICHYCRHCLMLGKISSCQPLHVWAGPPIPQPIIKNSLRWKGELSLGQKVASEAVVEAVEQKSFLLVWAVCGAGKTEVLFHGLERAFATGKRALLATPRTDVVKELYPRLQASFPDISMTALYGGSKDRHANAQLVLATTHQTMRFYKAFDVVIVDEVDAFPFSYDKSLQYAVEQAKKPTSSTILLSATPSSTLLKTSHLQVVKIPKRYHGFPLPVPCFKWVGNWQKRLKKNKLPSVVLDWIQTYEAKKKPLLLFVPSVSILTQVSEALQNQSIKHASVHAADPKRHEAVQAFRNRHVSIMVTTTILERGVTFADVQVAVLGAENDVFTEAALVQIAGRVGRKKETPTGEVIFFHYGVTKAMKAARRHIEQMNEEGGRA
ncbi:DEAD/DEAH box helicase [Alkalihalobacillus sp. MEB130]|uniref:DEAD/DEAH box helicase n=1 Tax=Alkalihalobacillus sp. MEB130 TaxID=2976704 RepID=UPI0028E04755|nr:DEAD/DEAH box helicase [Alkalihalobacillus sp. MEB130]MDT8858794.1 DEAD/DEAH box helicase [Alkalihalobacillus sp. MEB130]